MIISYIYNKHTNFIMILIKDKNIPATIKIPKNVYLPIQAVYKIYLEGLTTKTTHDYIVIDEKNNVDYYVMSVDFKDLEEQEYKYSICPMKDVFDGQYGWKTEEGNVVATGLLRIGELTPNTKTIEKHDTIKYYE